MEIQENIILQAIFLWETCPQEGGNELKRTETYLVSELLIVPSKLS